MCKRYSDRSVDVIKDILSKSQTRINFKFIHHEKNKGVSAARNTGIRASTGEYLMFVDSDDKITNICSTLVDKIIGSDYDIIVGNRDIISTTGQYLHKPSTRIAHEVEMSTISDYEKYHFQGEVYNKIIKKDFIVKNNLFFTENILFEDTLWVNQIKCYSPKILYIPIVTYIYCLREGSTMTTYNNKHLMSQIECTRYAHIFASKAKIPECNRWYAYYSAYQFRKAALLYCFVRTTKSVSNFFSLYNILQKKYPLNRRYDLILPRLSKIQKIRYFSNRLPLVNRVIELIFIILKARQFKTDKLLMGVDSKLDLAKDFFKSVK